MLPAEHRHANRKLMHRHCGQQVNMVLRWGCLNAGWTAALTHTVCSPTQHSHPPSKRLAYRWDCSGQWADQEDLQSGKERNGQQAGQYSSTFQFGSANRKGVAKPDGLLVMPFEILADFDILNRLLGQKTSIVPHTTSCSHDENQGTGG